MRTVFLALTCLGASGCSGDPLAGMTRLVDVPVEQGAGQVGALPDVSEESLADAPVPQFAEAEKPRDGLLGFLRRKAEEGKVERAEVVAEVAVLSDEAPESELDAARLDVEPEKKGLLSRLLGKPATKPLSEPVAEEVILAALAPELPEPEAQAEVRAPEPVVEPERKGLVGRLLGKSGPETVTVEPPAQPLPPLRGAVGTAEAGPGVLLPFGEVGRLCGVSARSVGRLAERFPEPGAFSIHDSEPGKTEPRNFFLEGFDDGCLRQFTGALVMVGSVEGYEQLHYGMPADTLPHGETDAAYDALKGRVCGVPEHKPCGAQRGKLAADTAFVTLYETFEGSKRWVTLLLHDGMVLAVDVKS